MNRSRRTFLKHAAVTPLLLSQSPRYDLLIRGGHVIDPAEGLSQTADVAIAGGVIARVAPAIPESDAREVIDGRGKVVTPGLIDIHVHVYEGVAGVGIDPDVASVARGATTVVDAGSAGATTFPAFERYVVERAATRVYALLNLSSIGLASLDEIPDMSYADVDRAVSVIEANRDTLLGVKVRMTRQIAGGQDLEALRRAREIVDAVELPLMVHIGEAFSPLRDVLALLRPGDVVTHTLRARGSVLDDDGRVRPEAREARERGVWYDVGHGSGNFSFDTAERALAQGFPPDTISSDVHSRNFEGPVFDLATTLSKFLHLGLTLDEVVACATATPAKIFPFHETIGTLREGAEADAALFTLEEGAFELVDSTRATRVARHKLVPFRTVKSGRLFGGG